MGSLQQVSSISKLLASGNQLKSYVYAHHIHSFRNTFWQHSCASQFCMTRLKDKIENGLNEGRILLLGGQVLIGAGFRTIFTDGFEKLPKYAQTVQMASL